MNSFLFNEGVPEKEVWKQITLTLNPELKKYIDDLKSSYSTVTLKHIGALKSRYTIQFYFIMLAYARTGQKKWTFYKSLDDLRRLLDINENSYLITGDFRKFVIDRPIKELNEANIGFKITMDYNKYRVKKRLLGVEFICERTDENQIFLYDMDGEKAAETSVPEFAMLMKPETDLAQSKTQLDLRATLMNINTGLVFDSQFYPSAAAFLSTNGLDSALYCAFIYSQCMQKKVKTLSGLFYTLFFKENMVELFRNIKQEKEDSVKRTRKRASDEQKERDAIKNEMMIIEELRAKYPEEWQSYADAALQEKMGNGKKGAVNKKLATLGAALEADKMLAAAHGVKI
jgi:hypothetical protein